MDCSPSQGYRTSGRQRSRPRDFWRNEDLGPSHVVPVLIFPEVNDRRSPATGAKVAAKDGPSTSGPAPVELPGRQQPRRLSNPAGPSTLPSPRRQALLSSEHHDTARHSPVAPTGVGVRQQLEAAGRLAQAATSPGCAPLKGDSLLLPNQPRQPSHGGAGEALRSPERPRRALKVHEESSPGKSPTGQLVARRMPYQSPTRAAAKARAAAAHIAPHVPAAALPRPPAPQPAVGAADTQPGRQQDAKKEAPAGRKSGGDRETANAPQPGGIPAVGFAVDADGHHGGALGGAGSSPAKPQRRRGDPVLTSVIMVRAQAPDLVDLTRSRDGGRGSRKARAASAHAAGVANKPARAKPASAAAGTAAAVPAAGGGATAIAAMTAAAAAALVDSPLTTRPQRQQDGDEGVDSRRSADGEHVPAATGRRRTGARSSDRGAAAAGNAAPEGPMGSSGRGRSKVHTGDMHHAGADGQRKHAEQEPQQRQPRSHHQQQQQRHAPRQATAAQPERQEEDVDDEEVHRPSKRVRKAAAPQPAAADTEPGTRGTKSTKSTGGKPSSGKAAPQAPSVAAAAGAQPEITTRPPPDARAHGNAPAGAAGAVPRGARTEVAPGDAAVNTATGDADAAPVPAQPCSSALRRSSRFGPSSSHVSTSQQHRDMVLTGPTKGGSRGRALVAASADEAGGPAPDTVGAAAVQHGDGANATGREPSVTVETEREGKGKRGTKRRRGKPPPAPALGSHGAAGNAAVGPGPQVQARTTGAETAPPRDVQACSGEAVTGHGEAAVAAAAAGGSSGPSGDGDVASAGDWQGAAPPPERRAGGYGTAGAAGNSTADGAGAAVDAAARADAVRLQPLPAAPGLGQPRLVQRAGPDLTGAQNGVRLQPPQPLSPTESVAQSGALSPRQRRCVPQTGAAVGSPGAAGLQPRTDAIGAAGDGRVLGDSMPTPSGGRGYPGDQQGFWGDTGVDGEPSGRQHDSQQTWYGSPRRQARAIPPVPLFSAAQCGGQARSGAQGPAGPISTAGAIGQEQEGNAVGGFRVQRRRNTPASPRSAAGPYGNARGQHGVDMGDSDGLEHGHTMLRPGEEAVRGAGNANAGGAAAMAWQHCTQESWHHHQPLPRRNALEHELGDAAAQQQQQQEQWQHSGQHSGPVGVGEGELKQHRGYGNSHTVLGQRVTQDPYELVELPGEEPPDAEPREGQTLAPQCPRQHQLRPQEAAPHRPHSSVHSGLQQARDGAAWADELFGGPGQLQQLQQDLGRPDPSAAGWPASAPRAGDATASLRSCVAQPGLPGLAPRGTQAYGGCPGAPRPAWPQGQGGGPDPPGGARSWHAAAAGAAAGAGPSPGAGPRPQPGRTAVKSCTGGAGGYGDAMEVDGSNGAPGWQAWGQHEQRHQEQEQRRHGQGPSGRDLGSQGEQRRGFVACGAPPPQGEQDASDPRADTHDVAQRVQGLQAPLLPVRDPQPGQQTQLRGGAVRLQTGREDSLHHAQQAPPRPAVPAAQHAQAAPPAHAQSLHQSQPQQPAFRVPALRAAAVPLAFRAQQQQQQRHTAEGWLPSQHPGHLNGGGASAATIGRPAVNPLARPAVSLLAAQPAGSSGAAASTAAKAASDSIWRALQQADQIARRNKTRSQEVVEREEDGWTLEQVQALQTAYFRVEPTHPHFWREVARQVQGKTAAECFARVFASGRDREERAALAKILRRRPATEAAAAGPGSGKPMTLAAARKWSQKTHEREQLELLARLGGLGEQDDTGSEEEEVEGGAGATSSRSRAGRGGRGRGRGRRPQLTLPEDPTEMRRILDDIQQKHQADRFITSFLSKQGGWRKWHKAVREAQERRLHGLQQEQRPPAAAAAAAAAPAAARPGAAAAASGRKAATAAGGARRESDPLARVIRRMLAKDEAQQLRQMWREDDEAEGLDGDEYGAYNDDEEEEDMIGGGGGAHHDDEAEEREEEELRRFLVTEGLLGPDGMPVLK